MARVDFYFLTTSWNDAYFPLNEKQINELLSSSCSVWQNQNFLSYVNSRTNNYMSNNFPCVGAFWYQRSCMLSGFLLIATDGPIAWRNESFRRMSWIDGCFEQVAVTGDTTQDVVPRSNVWLNMFDARCWVNRAFVLRRIYPQMLRLTLLNASLFGPMFFIDVVPLMFDDPTQMWLTSLIGHDFKDISYRLIQSTYNLPFELDGLHDRCIRALTLLFILSYTGVVHQNRTLLGYYFQSKTRGLSTDAWTLRYNTTGQRVRPLAPNQQYYGIRSPSWNYSNDLCYLCALSSIVLSCRIAPLIRNDSVIPPARDQHGFSSPRGLPVFYFSLTVAANACLLNWRDGQLITDGEYREMNQQMTLEQLRQRHALEVILAHDDDSMAGPDGCRRIKPFTARDWTPGQSGAAIAALRGLVG
ncbi:core protein [Broome reovirus]|uniref:Core protein n=1 Tax=Broome reovirus TaxID=667093 RepID=A9UL19_9REOV|nr:core protein [Broome reovirus]AAY54282.1 major inner capsid protein sigma 1 [Broome reovirus]ACU68606.1 core protein [Broome reovirus]